MKRLLLLLTLLIVAACTAQTNTELVTAMPTFEAADHDQARDLMRQYGCRSCHVIPGLAGLDVHTGPALGNFRERSYIAGRLPNTPENLVLWIRNPQSIDHQTAMPILGLTEAQARIIMAYLYERT